jgi:hypothetical protein
MTTRWVFRTHIFADLPRLSNKNRRKQGILAAGAMNYL